MKKILIIIGNFSPDKSSVALCMEPLLDSLKKHFELDVITDRTRKQDSNFEVVDGVNIYRVDDHIMISHSKYLEKKKRLKSAKLMVYKAIFGTRFVLSHLKAMVMLQEKQSLGWSLQRAAKLGTKLQRMNSYAAIISVSLPFKSHQIAYKIAKRSNNKPKWFVYEFDPFFYNDEIKRCFFRKLYMNILQSSTFNTCDSILVTPELFEFYKNCFGINYTKKMTIVPFAGIQHKHQLHNSDTKSNTDEISILFAGRLYRRIRNPEFALNSFLETHSNIQFSIYTDYDLNELNSVIGNDQRINMYPFVSRQELDVKYQQSDVLVNIGNTVNFQVPGKLFELITTGKPIIHFSKIANDPAIKYLERYKISLIIDENKVTPLEAAKQIDKFVIENRNTRLSCEEVELNMGDYHGDFVSNQFVNYIRSTID